MLGRMYVGADVGAAVGAEVGTIVGVSSEGDGVLGGFVGIKTTMGGGGVGEPGFVVDFPRTDAKISDPEPLAFAAVFRKSEKTQNESNDMKVYPANFLNISLS